MPNTKSKIESLLYITNQSFSFKKLADLLKVEKKEVEQAVLELMTDYNQDHRGLHLQKVDDKVQLVTSPDNSKLIKDYIKEEFTGELSRAALETLTIVAYRGPIVRAELEQIRGVNCAIILRNLLIRGLVAAHEDKKKMQLSYSITLDFLHYLGINQPSELPEYERLNASKAIEQVLHPAKPSEEQS